MTVDNVRSDLRDPIAASGRPRLVNPSRGAAVGAGARARSGDGSILRNILAPPGHTMMTFHGFFP